MVFGLLYPLCFGLYNLCPKRFFTAHTLNFKSTFRETRMEKSALSNIHQVTFSQTIIVEIWRQHVTLIYKFKAQMPVC